MRDYTWNFALWGRMASCAPVANRRWMQHFVSADRRVSNPPQVGNLPHSMEPRNHAALREDFCAANMPLARSNAMPNAAVTTRLSTAPG